MCLGFRVEVSNEKLLKCILSIDCSISLYMDRKRGVVLFGL